MKLKFVFLTFIGLMICFSVEECSFHDDKKKVDCKKIQVVERVSAMRMGRGFVVLSTDDQISFNGDRYLIKTREFFDENNEINHAMIWTEMGYEDRPKREIFKSRDFLEVYDLNRFVNALRIDKRHIKVNSDIGVIKKIDEKRKIIYYNIMSDKNTRNIFYIHSLIYK